MRRRKRRKELLQQQQRCLEKKRMKEWWGEAPWTGQRRPNPVLWRSSGGSEGARPRVSKSSAVPSGRSDFVVWENKRTAARTRPALFLSLLCAAATRSPCHSCSHTGIVYFKAVSVSLHGCCVRGNLFVHDTDTARLSLQNLMTSCARLYEKRGCIHAQG